MSSRYTVRPAAEPDIEAASKLVNALRSFACGLDWRLHRISEAGHIAAPDEIRGDIAHPDHHVLVVEHATDGVVGVLTGKVRTNSKRIPEVVGSVSRLFVEPGHRRRGLGRLLVSSMCAWFAERGVEAVTLRYVLSDQTSAAFWHALGFQPVIVTANCRMERLQIS